MKEFFKKLGDMFLDQGGGVDEKRVLGIPMVIASVVYVFITGNLGVFGVVFGGAMALLGISVAGDQGKLNVEIKQDTNIQSGIPQ